MSVDYASMRRVVTNVAFCYVTMKPNKQKRTTFVVSIFAELRSLYCCRFQLIYKSSERDYF